MHTSLLGPWGLVYDKYQVSLRHKKCFMVMGSSSCSHRRSKPSRLSYSGNNNAYETSMPTGKLHIIGRRTTSQWSPLLRTNRGEYFAHYFKCGQCSLYNGFSMKLKLLLGTKGTGGERPRMLPFYVVATMPSANSARLCCRDVYSQRSIEVRLLCK